MARRGDGSAADRRRRAWAAGLAVLFAGICLAPHARRLAAPSLYADDVARVEQLQVVPPWAMVWRPFNEHLAPAFEAVSLATWHLAGRRLIAAPRAFTAASLLPLPLILGLLGLVVRREVGSTTAALGAVALFALATGPTEVFWWYSASSFAWALLGALAAWWGVLRGGRAGALVAALAAFLAPTFSAIGLLAGPAAAVRALGGRWSGRVAGDGSAVAPDSWFSALAPLLGTAAYLSLYVAVLGGAPGSGGAAEGPSRGAALAAGVLDTLRAPAAVLLPGMVGRQDDFVAGLPPWAGVILGLAAPVFLLVWAARNPARRGLVGGALVLVVGGYLLTFCARAGTADAGWSTLRVQRYHLFPQLGAVLILAALARPVCARLDRRPLAGLGAAVGLALGLGFANRGVVEERLRYLSFPDQSRTLAALEQVSVTSRASGITRAQALAALDPIHPSWMPIDWYNALGMLGEGAPEARVPDAEVRSILLDSLDLRAREALCVGLDVTPYLEPAGAPLPPGPPPLHRFGVAPKAGPGGLPVALGAMAFVEWPWEGTAASHLVLPASAPGRTLELWWTDDVSVTWSETRSLRWTTPEPASPADAWSVPLSRAPHFAPRRVARVRIIARTPGAMTLGAPALR